MISLSHKSLAFKRLPQRKRMTICIGMLASDGLVVAADAQESDTYYKRPQQKIFPWVGAIQLGSSDPAPPQMASLFTGAGDAGYIDAYIDYAMAGIDHNMHPQQLEGHLRKTLLDFHRSHIFPLARITDPPQIAMLIGTYCRFQTRLWVTHGSTLRSAFHRCAVGIGAHFALSVMEDLPARMTVKEAELCAAFVIAATKERIEGCGQYTAIYSLHGPSIVEASPGGPSQLIPSKQPMTMVSGSKIYEWEKSFAGKWTPQQRKLLFDLIKEEMGNDPTPSDSETSEDQQ